MIRRLFTMQNAECRMILFWVVQFAFRTISKERVIMMSIKENVARIRAEMEAAAIAEDSFAAVSFSSAEARSFSF